MYQAVKPHYFAIPYPGCDSEQTWETLPAVYPTSVTSCDALEKFTGEQHKDLRPNTQSGTTGIIFVQWLKAYPPFAGYEPDRLVSLSIGIVADASVNCDIAVEIGRTQMDGQTFTDIKLHRNDKVPTIGEKCKTIKVGGQNTVVQPRVLFKRITAPRW